MSSIYLWPVLSDLKPEIVSKINKIIVFGEKGTEVIFSTRDGKVYGFGNNSFGELGFGHKNEVKEPQNIVELNDKQVIDFSYGSKHVLTQTITGKLYSWGENIYGQLGNGTIETDYRPKLIDSLSDKCVIAISCGPYHTFVLTDDNQLYGFGSNYSGAIGCGVSNNQWKPIKINGFNDELLVSISCGFGHSLALTQTGNVYSWGHNRWGQLGIGNKTDTNIPTKIVVSNGLLFKQIVCGNSHSLLLSECGDVYGFGYNSYGSLGTGNTEKDFSFPTKIEGINRVKEIASHSRLDISMAKLEDNNYLVWGKCLTGNILKPMQTRLKSFNDINAVYAMEAITVKPIENEINLNKTLKNISKKFNDRDFSDRVFKVGIKEIFVNKSILILNSDYFRNKYSVKSKEIEEFCVEKISGIYEVWGFRNYKEFEIIDNYSYEVFYSYLKYIYTECVEIENQYLDQLLILSLDYKERDLIIECFERIFNSDNNCIQLENIAQLIKYSIDNNMNEIKAKCIDRIKSMTTIENVCNVYEVLIKYGFNELGNNCLEFIRGLNKKSLLKTDSYKMLSKDIKLEIMEKLIITLDLNQ